MAKTDVQAGSNATPDYRAIVAAWTPEERAEKEKKFLRKIDTRLLPILVRALLPRHFDSDFQ
jgi:hypothetical protein